MYTCTPRIQKNPRLHFKKKSFSFSRKKIKMLLSFFWILGVQVYIDYISLIPIVIFHLLTFLAVPFDTNF